MGSITLEHVNKTFGGHQVIPDVSLDIKDGEFVVFVGPSGCGKSTLLRLIAGLEDTTSGAIKLDGVDVTDKGPAHRGLAMVFQSYALYPHMTVRQNIAFPLKMANIDKAIAEQKVADAARLLRGGGACEHQCNREQPVFQYGHDSSLRGGGASRVRINTGTFRKFQFHRFVTAVSCAK